MCGCVCVQDLTQYNTAHNRQISTVGIRENEKPRKHKHRPSSVCFAEEEEIINPGTYCMLAWTYPELMLGHEIFKCVNKLNFDQTNVTHVHTFSWANTLASDPYM